MKDKGGQTQTGEVQYKRRASALPENHKQSDEQVDQSD